MKEIKVFLASSEELADERIKFGDFIRQLDDTYEQRGFRVKLIKWEDLPSGDDGRPKQDEYNEQVRQSDMFVGLFHTKVGKYTLEEYNTAKTTQQIKGSPTLYVFCRELTDDEIEEPSLTAFKERLLKEIRHYWNKYNNSDSLQLQFVMQLLKVENNRWNDLKVENGSVRFGGKEIARMENLCFATDNKDYQRMQQRLEELPEEIEDARLLVREHPDKDRYKDKLQRLLDERNQLQNEFEQQQKLLLDTAMRIVQLQGETISENRKRAEEAFERGDVQTANIILDEAERNGDALFEEYLHNEVIQQQRRRNIHQTIDDLLLQATTVMADLSIPINVRIEKTISIYNKADERAGSSGYSKEKYSELLFLYANFLLNKGKYKDSEIICFRQIALSEELNGKEHPETANSYCVMGSVYNILGEYLKALKYYHKALVIREKVLGLKHPDTATIYNYIGLVCSKQGNYSGALDYYRKALAIWEIVFGEKNHNTSTSYNNIGFACYRQGKYSEALDNYSKALAIREELFGKVHPDTATIYNNIGLVFYCQGNCSEALEYYGKVLDIWGMVLGEEHPDMATVYNNIGSVYVKQGKYLEALEYFGKDLSINEKVFGEKHPDTAYSYNNIGSVYQSLGEYPKALEYYGKALTIREKVLGVEHPDTAYSYNNIGSVYQSLGEYSKALEYYGKAIAIIERVLSVEHPDMASSYNNVGSVYQSQGKYSKALEYYGKALAIREKTLGLEHPDTKKIRGIIRIVNRLWKDEQYGVGLTI